MGYSQSPPSSRGRIRSEKHRGDGGSGAHSNLMIWVGPGAARVSLGSLRGLFSKPPTFLIWSTQAAVDQTLSIWPVGKAPIGLCRQSRGSLLFYSLFGTAEIWQKAPLEEQDE